jgi:hypothetical protein
MLRRMDTVYCTVCTLGPRRCTEVRNFKPETFGERQVSRHCRSNHRTHERPEMKLCFNEASYSAAILLFFVV